MRDQRFLLADEPTGNLDSATADAVLDLLETLAGDGRSLIYVTHNEAIAERAQRRLHVFDGIVKDD